MSNTAKLYCLNWINSALERQNGEGAILDLGCGDASYFVPLLDKYPALQYVGVEPLEASYKAAQRNLQGKNAKVVQMYAYDLAARLGQKFDFIVSFSTMEHVYRRAEYMRSVRECLKENGQVLINYDAGHFVAPTFRDRLKNIIGPIAARFGMEQYYQSFVHEAEFSGLVEQAGLKVIDAKFFNSRLKGVYKVVPMDCREDFTRQWYDLELWLNESGLAYTDAHAHTFFSRNFILTPR